MKARWAKQKDPGSQDPIIMQICLLRLLLVIFPFISPLDSVWQSCGARSRHLVFVDISHFFMCWKLLYFAVFLLFYVLHWTLRSVHCTLEVVHYTLFIEYCLLQVHTERHRLHTVHCTLHTEHCTLHTAHSRAGVHYWRRQEGGRGQTGEILTHLEIKTQIYRYIQTTNVQNAALCFKTFNKFTWYSPPWGLREAIMYIYMFYKDFLKSKQTRYIIFFQEN